MATIACNVERDDQGRRRQAIDVVRHSTTNLSNVAAPITGDVAGFNRICAIVHEMCASIAEAERAGVDPDALRAALEPAWHIHGRSPFIKRLQTWPRGYPGDYETINYLLDGVNHAEPGTVEHVLEGIALGSPISQQHRNKVYAQADAISLIIQESRIARKPKRVLVLACGSCPDIGFLGAQLEEVNCSIVVNDVDPDAIEASRRRLHSTGNITFITGNMFRSFELFRERGRFDAIVAGGLFDYLPDKAATKLVRKVFEDLLTLQGVFTFTNIDAGNPYRSWIENLASWSLIERSGNDIARIIRSAGNNLQFTTKRDGTGLTHIVKVSRG